MVRYGEPVKSAAATTAKAPETWDEASTEGPFSASSPYSVLAAIAEERRQRAASASAAPSDPAAAD